MQPVVCILPALLLHNKTSCGSGSQYQSARHVKIHESNARPAMKIARTATAKVTRGPILSVASLERLQDKSTWLES